jgi:hypothetical protein
LLDEQLEDAMVALGAICALLADGLVGGRALRAAADGASRDAGGGLRARRRDGRHGRDDDRKGARAKARGERAQDRFVAGDGDERDGDDSEHDLEAGAAPAGARDRDRDRDAGAKGFRVPAPRMPLRAGLRRRPAAGSDARAPVERGTRVRVLEGPFAGKVGVVQELDGKGGARVLLGLLAVRLAVKDLVALLEGRARPLLSSSHRKRVPVRS